MILQDTDQRTSYGNVPWVSQDDSQQQPLQLVQAFSIVRSRVYTVWYGTHHDQCAKYPFPYADITQFLQRCRSSESRWTVPKIEGGTAVTAAGSILRILPALVTKTMVKNMYTQSIASQLKREDYIRRTKILPCWLFNVIYSAFFFSWKKCLQSCFRGYIKVPQNVGT